MKKVVVGLFLVALMVMGGCKSEDYVTLLSPDGPSYSIYIEDDSNDQVRKAGADLAYYLSEASGVPITISIDTSDHPLIKVGQYYKADLNLLESGTVAYWVAGDELIISGGDDQAITNSIYAFLENEIGVEFLAPDAELIPRHNKGISLSRDLAYSYIPAIDTRTVHSDLFYKNLDFARKRRVTSEGFPGYAKGARVHTFHRFVPAEDYYYEHPEYFALRNGKRITSQLCLTNEAVLEIIKSKVGAIIKSYPEAKVISVSQDDNTQYCQCDQCEAIHTREGSASGSMIYFINKVAAAYPEIQISTLAYQYTRKAPKYIRPASNVLVTLCSIECDRSAPIDEKCREFTEDLMAWSHMTDNIRIWDYTTQFTNFLAPFPNLWTLKPNIELFVKNNAKWIFEQHSRQPSELFELRSYVLAQLLWDPSQDIDLLIERFATAYYEEAGGKVLAYINGVHHAMEQDSNFFLFLYGDPAQGFDTWLSRYQLAQYDELFDEAEMLVSDKPDILDRVRAARLSVDFAILEYGRKDLTTSTPIGGLPLLDRLKRFNNTTSEQGITSMNEVKLMVSEYVASYLSAIERRTTQNIALGEKVTLLTKPSKYANEDPQVLTDGALGGLNFYSNWLGFEGEHAEVVVDLGVVKTVSRSSTAFLQVTNHIVFLPKYVSFYGSADGVNYKLLGKVDNPNPLNTSSKINDVQFFELEFSEAALRYIKVKAESHLSAPDWHNASGLPAWIFIDELMIS